MRNSSKRRNVWVLIVVLSAIWLFPEYSNSATIGSCPDNITSYWKFDESSGEIFADSLGVKDASCVTGSCPAAVAGKIDGAQQFSATSQVNVADDSTFDWGPTDSFTVEFWMKTDSSSTCSGNQVIVGRNDSSTGLHWWVGCTGAGGSAEFELIDSGSDGSFVTGSTDLTDGGWHHIVAVRDDAAGEIRIYVDGIKEGSAAANYSSGFGSDKALNIGWLNLSPYYHFAGTIDEVALYNRALSENEIRQNYYDGAIGLRRGYCGCSSPVRIMPLGDSITTGYISDLTNDYMVGYRQKLFLDLTNAGYGVDFVGSMQAGTLADPTFDTDHEGHGGYTAAQVADDVYGWLTGNPPDVVLLHIGTNEIDRTTAADVEDILNAIDQYDSDTGSDITVVLARIINQQVPIAAVTTFNDDVVSMAQNRIANGAKIMIVDQEHALTYPDDMSSTVHPNATGYEKMAQVWMNALVNFLPACGEVAPQIISEPVTEAYEGLPYDYEVKSFGVPAITFSLTESPPGMTIDPGTGLIEWTPDTMGSFDVTVQASNGVGSPSSQSFSVEVHAPPLCPSEVAHYWKFDEISGAPYTDFYGTADAQCNATCPVAATGRINGAQKFNGTNQVNVADDDTFDWGASSSFSIEFWMKTDSSSTCSGNEVIVGRDDSSTHLHWWVGCSSTGGRAAFTLLDTNGNGTYVSGTSDLTDGQWHHVVAVRNGTTNEIRIYVDGTKEGAATWTYSAGFGSNKALNIGWLNLSPYYHFAGTLDEVAIYNRALSQTEVMQHFSDGQVGSGYCGYLSYAVTPSAAGNGSIDPSTPQMVKNGETASFTVTPDAGYHISSVTGCGGTLNGNSYVTAAITGNCIVTAGFAVNTYAITGGVTGGHGTISCTPSIVDYQGNFLCSLYPAYGYQLASLTDNGSDVTGLVSPDNKYSFTNVTSNHAVTASFTQNPPVRRVSGGATTYYSTLQDACDPGSTNNGDVIESQAMSLNESLIFNLDRQVMLEGGYDPAFQSNAGYTTINSLTISNGTMTVDRLIIK